MTVDMDYYVNVKELMTDIDLDRAEPLSELPITSVECTDGDYYEEVVD